MRVSRYMFSEKLNPWMAGIAALAPWVRAQRQPASADNPFVVAERGLSEQISRTLDAWRKLRDEAQESVFHARYRSRRNDQEDC